MKAPLLGSVLALLACGSPPPPAGPPAPAVASTSAPASASPAWITQLERAHPLVGKVWDARAGAFVSEPQLIERLVGARYVLLGEKHDNPDHHVLQARLLSSLVRGGRRPALVLEMLEPEQQAKVDRYRSSPGATAFGFGAAVGWPETSWPPFAQYRPILEAAFAGNLTIAAGNIARETARALVKQGLSALPPERVQQLRLHQALPEPLAAELAAELRASHCGHLPERSIEPMGLAQRARDAQMAAVMLASGAPDGAVLIAGNGHVRRDRGVPYHLELAAPGAAASLLSVALQEVAPGANEARAYAQAVDFVWFTPRVSDEDPCAAFAK